MGLRARNSRRPSLLFFKIVLPGKKSYFMRLYKLFCLALADFSATTGFALLQWMYGIVYNTVIPKLTVSEDKELMDEIIECVDDFYIENLRSPYTAEIGEALGIAKSTVHRYLVEMDERNMLEYGRRRIVTPQIRKFSGDITRAGILGSVACGEPEYAEENFEEYVTLPVALFGKGDFFILRAHGYSMVEAGIEPGDMVVVKKQNTANEGDIVVALVGSDTTLKRYYTDRKRRCVRLHPENKEMTDILTKDCRIQGVAQHVIKAL